MANRLTRRKEERMEGFEEVHEQAKKQTVLLVVIFGFIVLTSILITLLVIL